MTDTVPAQAGTIFFDYKKQARPRLTPIFTGFISVIYLWCPYDPQRFMIQPWDKYLSVQFLNAQQNGSGSAFSDSYREYVSIIINLSGHIDKLFEKLLRRTILEPSYVFSHKKVKRIRNNCPE